MMICPFCEQEIPDNTEVCPECGTKLSNAMQVNEEEKEEACRQEFEQGLDRIKEKNRKDTWKKVIVCLVIVGIVIGFVAQKYIRTNIAWDTMTSSYSENHGKRTYYEAFNSAFTDEEWDCRSLDEFLFSGTCIYYTKWTNVDITFELVNINGKDMFAPTCVSIDDEEYTGSAMGIIIDYIFLRAEYGGIDDLEYAWDYYSDNKDGFLGDEYDESEGDEWEDTESYGDVEDTEDVEVEADNLRAYIEEYIYYEGLADYSLSLIYEGDYCKEYELHMSVYDEHKDKEYVTDSRGTVEGGVSGTLIDEETGRQWVYEMDYLDDHYIVYLYGDDGTDVVLHEKAWADENAG